MNCPDLPETVLKPAREWAKNPKGIMTFYGVPGAGKTYLAMRVDVAINVCTAANSRFMTEREFIKHKRDIMAGSVTWDICKKAYAPEVLIFDDLGECDNATNFVIDAINELITSRERFQWPMLITTNLTLGQIQEKFGPRIASRINGGHKIEFPARDLRHDGSLK